MNRLLAITAVIESGTGVSLALAPSSVALILLGSTLDSPAGLTLGRLLGAAVFALGTACWLARRVTGPAATELVAAMLLYNFAAVLLLSHARIGLRLSGVGLLPAVILHAILMAWCVACLRIKRRNARNMG